MWKEYFLVVDGIVFLVDVCDRERFVEVKVELDVSMSYIFIRKIILLIVGKYFFYIFLVVNSKINIYLFRKVYIR